MKKPPSGHTLETITLTSKVKVTDLPYGLPKAHIGYKRAAHQYDARIRAELLEGGK